MSKGPFAQILGVRRVLRGPRPSFCLLHTHHARTTTLEDSGMNGRQIEFIRISFSISSCFTAFVSFYASLSTFALDSHADHRYHPPRCISAVPEIKLDASAVARFFVFVPPHALPSFRHSFSLYLIIYSISRNSRWRREPCWRGDRQGHNLLHPTRQ